MKNRLETMTEDLNSEREFNTNHEVHINKLEYELAQMKENISIENQCEAEELSEKLRSALAERDAYKQKFLNETESVRTLDTHVKALVRNIIV